LRPEVLAGFLINVAMYGSIYLFGLWAHKKGEPAKWYELLTVVIGSLVGAYALVLASNFHAVWLTLLVPSAILIGFGWWRVVSRYKASTAMKK
jgi:hypothetical protein